MKNGVCENEAQVVMKINNTAHQQWAPLKILYSSDIAHRWRKHKKLRLDPNIVDVSYLWTATVGNVLRSLAGQNVPLLSIIFQIL